MQRHQDAGVDGHGDWEHTQQDPGGDEYDLKEGGREGAVREGGREGGREGAGSIVAS